jgi:hypothetical protein
MAVTLNANSSTGFIATSDTSGVLQLQTGGTTAVTVDASQNVTLANGTTIQGLTVGRGAGAVSTNTAVGASALAANTTGTRSVAVGSSALAAQVGGEQNVAVGYQTLTNSTSGNGLVGVGFQALASNTTGGTNTAVGMSALQANTTASNNTAVGYQAGYSNTTGASNVIIGQIAGYTSTTGNFNTYVGREAGNLTTGSNNQFIGNGAGRSVTTGQGNSIFGNFSGNQGGLDIRTASNYIVLSDGDGNPRVSINSTGSTQFFGYNTIQASTLSGANTSSANAIFAGFYGSTTPLNGTACIFITSNGNLYNTNGLYGTLSDAKLKENIVDASSQWDDIKALRVRKFNFKEGQTHTQIGYIAQEVEVVSPSLVDTNPDVDSEGNDLGTTTKSLKLSVINIKAVKALQEAMERIEKLEAELAAMKGTS